MKSHMTPQTNDHDLLIELRTQMALVLDEIKSLKDVTLSRIISLEKDKADRTEVQVIQKKVNEDIEDRMRVLEKSVVDKIYYDDKHSILEKQINCLTISDAVINAKASMTSVYISYGIGILGLIISILAIIYH